MPHLLSHIQTMLSQGPSKTFNITEKYVLGNGIRNKDKGQCTSWVTIKLLNKGHGIIQCRKQGETEKLETVESVDEEMTNDVRINSVIPITASSHPCESGKRLVLNPKTNST